MDRRQPKRGEVHFAEVVDILGNQVMRPGGVHVREDLPVLLRCRGEALPVDVGRTELAVEPTPQLGNPYSAAARVSLSLGLEQSLHVTVRPLW